MEAGAIRSADYYGERGTARQKAAREQLSEYAEANGYLAPGRVLTELRAQKIFRGLLWRKPSNHPDDLLTDPSCRQVANHGIVKSPAGVLQ